MVTLSNYTKCHTLYSKKEVLLFVHNRQLSVYSIYERKRFLDSEELRTQIDTFLNNFFCQIRSWLFAHLLTSFHTVTTFE